MHLGYLANLAHRLHRLVNPLDQIVIKSQVSHGCGGVPPACDENAVALVREELDHAFFRRKVQHIVLVDPRSDDQDGHLVDLCRGGCVVNQLHQSVAHDHFARCGGQFSAHLEGIGFHHSDVFGLDVAQQVFQTFFQAVTLGVQVLAHGNRVAEEKVGGCHRIQPLPRPERGAPALWV